MENKKVSDFDIPNFCSVVNYISVVHEVMNGCENLKIHFRLALKI